MTTMTDDRDGLVGHIETFLVRRGEPRFSASVLAETVADAAIALSRANALGEDRSARDYVDSWLAGCGQVSANAKGGVS